MKNIIITLLLTLVTIGAQSQKIKIKKGAILVDKVKIGQIEKLKIKNDSVKETYHQVSDNEGNLIFNFRQEYIPSLLFLEDGLPVERTRFWAREFISKKEAMVAF